MSRLAMVAEPRLATANVVLPRHATWTSRCAGSPDFHEPVHVWGGHDPMRRSRSRGHRFQARGMNAAFANQVSTSPARQLPDHLKDLVNDALRTLPPTEERKRSCWSMFGS